MHTVFIAFALAITLCLTAWAYRHAGCMVAILAFVVTILCFDFLEQYVLSVSKWLDARQAEKAIQAEQERAKKDAEKKEAEERRQKAAAFAEAQRIQAEKKRIQEAKDEKIRSFVLKDAPKVWAVYQSLQSEIDVQNGKIEELRKTLEAFGKDPDRDVDFQRICDLRDDMIRSRKALRTKLEDAYIAAKKYEASPSRKDYQDTMKRALEDGINDANMATERYKALTRQK